MVVKRNSPLILICLLELLSTGVSVPTIRTELPGVGPVKPSSQQLMPLPYLLLNPLSGQSKTPIVNLLSPGQQAAQAALSRQEPMYSILMMVRPGKPLGIQMGQEVSRLKVERSMPALFSGACVPTTGTGLREPGVPPPHLLPTQRRVYLIFSLTGSLSRQSLGRQQIRRTITLSLMTRSQLGRYSVMTNPIS